MSELQDILEAWQCPECKRLTLEIEADWQAYKISKDNLNAEITRLGEMLEDSDIAEVNAFHAGWTMYADNSLKRRLPDDMATAMKHYLSQASGSPTPKTDAEKAADIRRERGIDPDGCDHGIPWHEDCGWCFQAGEKVRGPDDSRQCPECGLSGDVHEIECPTIGLNGIAEIERYKNLMREIQAATSDKVILAITDKALCGGQ